MVSQYYIPTRILYGKGALRELHKQNLPFTKALLVTTNGKSVKRYGYLRRVRNELKKANITPVLFDKVQGNPTHQTVLEGVKLLKEENCDVIVALGGGSPIDTAKAIAVLATNEGTLWDYLSCGSGKGKPIENDPLKIIAINTTAGTGTECDPWSVITDETIDEKIGWGIEKTFPYLGICDPELMLTVPDNFSMYQGFDALFHVMEGYIHPMASPLSKALSLKAISLISENLPLIHEDPNNIDARENMALAALIGGMVECYSSCTFEHILEHAISSCYHDVIHGAGLIAISDAYFANVASSHKKDDELEEMAKALWKKADKPGDIVKGLRKLKKKCGVSDITLTSFGIQHKDISKIARKAISLCTRSNGKVVYDDPLRYNFTSIRAILKESL